MDGARHHPNAAISPRLERKDLRLSARILHSLPEHVDSPALFANPCPVLTRGTIWWGHGFVPQARSRMLMARERRPAIWTLRRTKLRGAAAHGRSFSAALNPGSAGVRPHPFAGFAATLSALAPRLGPVGWLRQRGKQSDLQYRWGRLIDGGGETGLAGCRAGSMNAKMSRPLAVTLQPPLMRSTSPCEKMSRSGTRLARRLVGSVQSRPLVARMAMSRLRSSMTAKPSG